MKEIRVRATVEGGRLRFRSASYVRRLLSKFNGKVVVTITEAKEPRSLSQNAYYWGVVLPTIAEHTGHTTEELHEILKKMFLPYREVQWKTGSEHIPGTTTELSISGFSEYLERIIAEAGTMGIEIPDTEEFWKAQREKTKEKVKAILSELPNVEQPEDYCEPSQIPF